MTDKIFPLGVASKTTTRQYATMATLGVKRQRKRRSSDVTSQLLVFFLMLTVIIMVVLNVWILWPTKTSNGPIHPNKDDDTTIKTAGSNAKNTTANKNRIVDIFYEAGIQLTEEDLQNLPTWEEIQALVGDAPVVHGLDTCAAFRSSIPAVERNLGAAGMFNTGTNLVTQLLKENCKIPERVEKYGIDASREAHGIRWQTSWGKHTLARFRLDHATDHAKDIDKRSILPVVTIRDPYNWMASMCRNHYSAKWSHSKANCPHLVERPDPFIISREKEPVGVKVTYAGGRTSSHDSLAGLWNDWYNDYLKADYPRLVVRFEDLIFYPREMTTLICECAGGDVLTPFSHIVQPAKTGPGHGKKSERTGMVQAWIQYGKPQERMGGFSETDYRAAIEFLDQDIMQTFGYSHPPAT